jgi:NAD(P)-dependent dehydrogenase (short-subunit alcohol dehydrogenase family)
VHSSYRDCEAFVGKPAHETWRSRRPCRGSECFDEKNLQQACQDELRAVFEANVFGVVAVTQAMLPLLREAPEARIVNVSSAAGSLTRNSDPAFSLRSIFGPVYPASKTALNAMTLAMAIELESTGIKVNAVSPGFTKTNLNNYAGKQTVEEGARAPVRLALLGADGPTGTFSGMDGAIPW